MGVVKLWVSETYLLIFLFSNLAQRFKKFSPVLLHNGLFNIAL